MSLVHGHRAPRRASGDSPGRRLLACALVGASACAEAEIVDAPGERIDIHYSDEYELCAGTVSYFDRGVVSVAEQLGLAPDTFEHFTYTWIGGEEFSQASPFYFEEQDGWAWGSKSYGKHPIFFHEIVHMVVHQDKYNAITFLTEGIATAFQGPGPPSPRSAEPVRVDPRPILGAHYRRMDYAVAGAFVTYLIARFGSAPLMELNRQLRILSTGGKFRRRFERIYGLDLDIVVDDYLTDDTCPPEMTPPLPPSCLGESIPWLDEERWVYARVISCSDEDVAGGIGAGFDVATVSVTITVEETGWYDLVLSTDHQLHGALAQCGGCPWLEPQRSVGVGYNRVGLNAGVYALTLSGRASADVPFVVELRHHEG